MCPILFADYDPVGSMQGLAIGNMSQQNYAPGNIPDNYNAGNVLETGSVYRTGNMPDLARGMPDTLAVHYSVNDAASSITGHSNRSGRLAGDQSQMGAWFDSDV